MKYSLIVLIISIMFCGCATIYKPIQPNQMSYFNNEIGGNFSYSYKFDVLKEKGNKRYVKKEDKFDIHIIAVKIINNTDTMLNVNNDLQFFVNDKQVYPLESMVVTSRIKQIGIGYILYGLLALYVSDGTNVVMIPIGIPIALGNMIAAGAGNTRFKEEFTRFNLVDKTIGPFETLNGLVAFSNIHYGKLEIRKVNKVDN